MPVHLNKENPPTGLTVDFWEHAKKRKKGNPEYGDEHQQRFEQMRNSLEKLNRIFDEFYGVEKELEVKVHFDLKGKHQDIVIRLRAQKTHLAFFCQDGHQRGQQVPLRRDDWEVVRSAQEKLDEILKEQEEIRSQQYRDQETPGTEAYFQQRPKKIAAAKEIIVEAIKSIEINIDGWKKGKLKDASENIENAMLGVGCPLNDNVQRISVFNATSFFKKDKPPAASDVEKYLAILLRLRSDLQKA